MVRTKELAKADCPHGKRVREQAKIDAEKRGAVHKYSWYSELDAEALVSQVPCHPCYGHATASIRTFSRLLRA